MKKAGVALLVLLSTGACGGKKPAQSADDVETTESSAKKDDDSSSSDSKASSGDAKAAKTAPAGDGTEPPTQKKDDCVGFEIADLEAVLNKVACETENPKPDEKFLDAKDKLDIKVSTSTSKVAPGQHVDVLVTFTNKTKEPMPLLFTVDPTPRFEIEAYDAKNRRVDMPSNQPPPLPKGVSPRMPGDPKTAKVTLAANGTARVRLGWDAVKMKWAPEKVRGTPPEKGYPRTPAGPLPKGKYTLRIVMPLTGIVEGMDKEVSAPKIPIEVGK